MAKQDPLALWHQIVAGGAPEKLELLLAEDAVFYSPVVHTPQRGKMLTRLYLTAAFQVFFNDTFKYVREVVGDDGAILEFEVEIDGIQVNGVDMLTWNSAGQLTEFKVMLRPLKAIDLIHQKMAEMLTALHNH